MNRVHIPPFSTAAMLDELRAAGVLVQLADGAPKVKFSEACPASPGLIEELKSRRAEIIEILGGQVSQICETSPEPAFGSKLAAAAVRIDAEHRAEAARSEARRLLRVIRTAGGIVTLEGDQVRVRGLSAALDADTVAKLKSVKPALIEVLTVEAKA